VGTIIVDSAIEIERLAAIVARTGATQRVLVRVISGVHAETHDFLATAHEDQKFGFPFPDAERAVARIREIPGLVFAGLHCHIGSQIFGRRRFPRIGVPRARPARVPCSRTDPCRSSTSAAGSVSPTRGVDDPTPIEGLAAAIVTAVAEDCAARGIPVPALSFEPGRAIVGTAGVTIYEVGTTKDVTIDSGAVRRYISVDGGMSDNARPALYGAQYSARLASRVGEGEPRLSRVVGKHCESGDIVVDHEYLPEDLVPGDLLAVPATGAYCVSLASNYNHVPRPPVVAVRGGRSTVIVRGETIDDVLARDAGIDGAIAPEGDQ
jgi:diaminopimelate decarboxylase